MSVEHRSKKEIIERLRVAEGQRDLLQIRMADLDEMARYRWKQEGREDGAFPGGPLSAYDTMLRDTADALSASKSRIRELEDENARLLHAIELKEQERLWLSAIVQGRFTAAPSAPATSGEER